MADASARDRELQVLSLVARPRLTPTQLLTIRALTTAPFDWNRFLALARAHGVWPLAHTHLAAADAPTPPDVTHALGRGVLETTALNLSSVAQLAGVLDRLAGNGIPAVGFKGPVLAALAYGQVGHRPFTDLDVLVSRDGAARARAVLHASGYKDADQYSIVDGVYPRAGREYVLVPAGWTGLTVELKMDVSDWTLPVALDGDQLIARGIEVDVAGRRVRTLSHEDNLLALVLHGMRHTWTMLRFVSDIHAVASLPIDWPALQARAAAARMSRMLHVAVLLSRAMLETPLPPDVLADAARDRAARRVARTLEERMFQPMTPRQLRWSRIAVSLSSREQLADKCRFAIRTVAFEQAIRPLDEWRSTRENAGAWRSAKVARRLAVPLLLLAVYGASQTSRPLLVGGTVVAALMAIFLAIHAWASRREPVRAWSQRRV
jgi:hypothetical protein